MDDDAFHNAIHDILDRCDAYRQAAVRREYPAAVIDAMVTQYHWLLMQEIDREGVENHEARIVAIRRVAKLMGEPNA